MGKDRRNGKSMQEGEQVKRIIAVAFHFAAFPLVPLCLMSNSLASLSPPYFPFLRTLNHLHTLS